MVAFEQVSYRAGNRQILREISLRVAPGETLVLLGRSGSGKTTALKMVNGLLRPASGQVVVDGKPVSDWDPIRLKRSIGYVIQETGLFPHYTVAENVGLVPRLERWSAAAVSRRVAELLEQVGLPPDRFAGRYPRELSGGQRQRVGVARALAADPPLLLFDEPFGALDPVTRHELQDQFLQLRRQVSKTSIFVTHDVREALRLGSRIVLLAQGEVALSGTPQDFLNSGHDEARAFRACLEAARP